MSGFWDWMQRAPVEATRHEWNRRLGTNFERVTAAVLRRTERDARWMSCPEQCCGGHRLVPQHDGGFLAICNDDEPMCEDVRITDDEGREWEMDFPRLGRMVARALELAPRDVEMESARCRQIGTFSGTGLPVVMVLPASTREFRESLTQACVRLRERFIVLAPTGRFMDVTCHALLKSAKAGFFDLESLLCLESEGTLRPLRRVAELFAPYPPTTAAAAAVAREAGNVFAKSGSVWNVTFDGHRPFHLRDTLGAEYLDYLLHHPGESISAYDLEMAIRPEKRAARPKDSVQQTLDADAVRDYLRQLDRLRGRRDEAADDGDLAAVDRLDDEMEAIESELRKNGQAPDAGERSRGNVSKAVAAVQQRLLKGDESEKAFGEHLEQFISMGYECIYRQPRGNSWR
jgi:hypothetical protein